MGHGSQPKGSQAQGIGVLRHEARGLGQGLKQRLHVRGTKTRGTQTRGFCSLGVRLLGERGVHLEFIFKTYHNLCKLLALMD